MGKGALVSLHGHIIGCDAETGAIRHDKPDLLSAYGDVGAKNGSTVVAAEYGDGLLKKTILTCTALPIAISDDADTAQYGGVKVYDFPEGLILVLGALVTGNFTGYASLIDTFDGDVALGTVTASTGATLVSTEADIMISNALATAVAEVAAVAGVSSATQVTESAAVWLDGTATAKDMFLNFVIDDNVAHGAGTANYTGVIELLWVRLGDN